MAKTVQELFSANKQIEVEVRSILETAEKESRDLTAEEQTNYDRGIADIQKNKREAEKIDRSSKLDVLMSSSAGRFSSPIEAEHRDPVSADVAMRNYLLNGERRDLSAGSDVSGGVTAPSSLYAECVKKLDNSLLAFQVARKIPLSSAVSLDVSTLDTNPASAARYAEGAAETAETTTAFGKRSLTPHRLSEHIVISKQLIMASAIDINAFVGERLGYTLALPIDNEFFNGSGAAGECLGVMVASPSGINTDRDVSTSNTTTAFTVDGLKNAFYSVKGQYRNSPKFGSIFHRDAIKMLSKLKDGNGQYLWQQSLIASQPDLLFGKPCYESEQMPNTFTTGLYVGIMGDFDYYWFAELNGLTIERDESLYRKNHQLAVFGHWYIDGMPIHSEAFARVKLA